MKFNKTKYDSLDGSTRVRFTLERGEPVGQSEFYIEGSRMGVSVHGDVLVSDRTELDAFAKGVADAWGEHLKLKPQLVRNLAGH